MTCSTDDPEKEQAYLQFVETIAPQCEPWNFDLNTKLVESGQCSTLPERRYFVLIRAKK